jgi:hypothetical protein
VSETKPAQFTFPVLVACGVGCVSLLTSVGTAYANHAVTANEVAHLKTEIARLDKADEGFRQADASLERSQADTRQNIAVMRVVLERMGEDTDAIRKRLEAPVLRVGGRR